MDKTKLKIKNKACDCSTSREATCHMLNQNVVREVTKPSSMKTEKLNYLGVVDTINLLIDFFQNSLQKNVRLFL